MTSVPPRLNQSCLLACRSRCQTVTLWTEPRTHFRIGHDLSHFVCCLTFVRGVLASLMGCTEVAKSGNSPQSSPKNVAFILESIFFTQQWTQFSASVFYPLYVQKVFSSLFCISHTSGLVLCYAVLCWLPERRETNLWRSSLTTWLSLSSWGTDLLFSSW